MWNLVLFWRRNVLFQTDMMQRVYLGSVKKELFLRVSLQFCNAVVGCVLEFSILVWSRCGGVECFVVGCAGSRLEALIFVCYGGSAELFYRCSRVVKVAEPAGVMVLVHRGQNTTVNSGLGSRAGNVYWDRSAKESIDYEVCSEVQDCAVTVFV
ncbi:hypothetical protein RYX36_032288 [Vicia faba]